MWLVSLPSLPQKRWAYVCNAADAKAGVYLYDFKSSTFFDTSSTFPFQYLCDFTINTVMYYIPNPNNPGHYNTNGVRFLYNFNTGQRITKLGRLGLLQRRAVGVLAYNRIPAATSPVRAELMATLCGLPARYGLVLQL